jgi:hypothetical protein
VHNECLIDYKYAIATPQTIGGVKRIVPLKKMEV